ncbi:MAG: hypothetical protein KJ607_05830 [Bacteroidetes bacterium]|nr:hypothetical protein [Bacteroidota bacterium]
MNWRVHNLVNKGILTRISKGRFRIGSSSLYQPEISDVMLKINRYLKAEFPYLLYCIWDTEPIRGLSHHLPSLQMTIVDVERDGMEFVFHSLQDKFNNVFLMPDNDIMEKYVTPTKKPIIIKALVTEAPVFEIEGVITGTIEKILIDIFFENEFESFRGSDIVFIFNNAFERYPININKLLRYAARKRKKEEILHFLTSNNMAAK